MIRGEPAGSDSFGERVRAARQRLRNSAGRRWTQGDLAGAVGVERNTVSRWENGSVLPREPAVLAALARTLRVSTDWLLDELPGTPQSGAPAGVDDASKSDRGAHPVPEPADRRGLFRESSGPGYQSETRALARLPAAAAQLVTGYLERLATAGCSADQISKAEATLVAGATQSIARRPLAERSDTEVVGDIDAAWDFVVRVLRREGLRP